MPSAVIVSAVRTAVGTARKGTLANTTAETLAAHIVRAAVERSGFLPEMIDDVVLAESMAGGGAIARHAAVELALLQAAGMAVTVVDYLKTPPDRAELARVLLRGGLVPRDLLRANEPLARELDLATADDDRLMALMLLHPALIERPVVETAHGVRIGRPPERVRDIL